MCVFWQVRTRRIDLFPLFEDFDRVKNGRVTRLQVKQTILKVFAVASADLYSMAT